MTPFGYEETWGRKEIVDLSVQERRAECEATLRLIKEELANLPEGHLEGIVLIFKLEDDELITCQGAGQVVMLLDTVLENIVEANVRD